MKYSECKDQPLRSSVYWVVTKEMSGHRLSSSRLFKRACGLCVGLAGAPLEVKCYVLGCISNPVYPYVNIYNLEQVSERFFGRSESAKEFPEEGRRGTWSLQGRFNQGL